MATISPPASCTQEDKKKTLNRNMSQNQCYLSHIQTLDLFACYIKLRNLESVDKREKTNPYYFVHLFIA